MLAFADSLFSGSRQRVHESGKNIAGDQDADAPEGSHGARGEATDHVDSTTQDEHLRRIFMALDVMGEGTISKRDIEGIVGHDKREHLLLSRAESKEISTVLEGLQIEEDSGARQADDSMTYDEFKRLFSREDTLRQTVMRLINLEDHSQGQVNGHGGQGYPKGSDCSDRKSTTDRSLGTPGTPDGMLSRSPRSDETEQSPNGSCNGSSGADEANSSDRVEDNYSSEPTTGGSTDSAAVVRAEVTGPTDILSPKPTGECEPELAGGDVLAEPQVERGASTAVLEERMLGQEADRGCDDNEVEVRRYGASLGGRSASWRAEDMWFQRRTGDVRDAWEDGQKRRERKQRRVFDRFDKDGDGRIDASDLRRLLNFFGKHPSLSSCEKLVNRLSAGTEHKGLLDFAAFQRVLGGSGSTRQSMGGIALTRQSFTAPIFSRDIPLPSEETIVPRPSPPKLPSASSASSMETDGEQGNMELRRWSGRNRGGIMREGGGGISSMHREGFDDSKDKVDEIQVVASSTRLPGTSVISSSLDEDSRGGNRAEPSCQQRNATDVGAPLQNRPRPKPKRAQVSFADLKSLVTPGDEVTSAGLVKGIEESHEDDGAVLDEGCSERSALGLPPVGEPPPPPPLERSKTLKNSFNFGSSFRLSNIFSLKELRNLLSQDARETVDAGGSETSSDEDIETGNGLQRQETVASVPGFVEQPAYLTERQPTALTKYETREAVAKYVKKRRFSRRRGSKTRSSPSRADTSGSL